MNLSLSAANDSTYGNVLGYANGNVSSGSSQVLHLTANSTVAFYNTDSIPHTASFLGSASAGGATYPPTFASANSMGMSSSPAGTAIDAANFSTGTVMPHSTSAVYATGGPGFSILGCAFHYDSNHMRTISIVQ